MRKIAIIGGGPRLTYILNALELSLPFGASLDLCIYDNSKFTGAGLVHSPDLPSNYIMNRPAEELSFFPDTSCSGWTRNACDPLTLSDYLVQQGLFNEIIDGYPTRRSFGLALRQNFLRAFNVLQGKFRVSLSPYTVRSIFPMEDGVIIGTADGFHLYDEVLLVTGHGHTSPLPWQRGSYPVYPILRGLGATSIDCCIDWSQCRDVSDEFSTFDIVSSSWVVPWARPVPGSPTLFRDSQLAYPGFLDNIFAKKLVSFENDILPSIISSFVYAFIAVEHGVNDARALSDLLFSDIRNISTSGRDIRHSIYHVLTERRHCLEENRDFSISALFSSRHRALLWDVFDFMLLGDSKDPFFALSRAKLQLNTILSLGRNDPSIFAVETVLRDWRPMLCDLVADERMLVSERSLSFEFLVPAMNKFVNGPPPITLRRFLDLCDAGLVKFKDRGEVDIRHDDVQDGFISTGDSNRNIVARLVDDGLAYSSLRFRNGRGCESRISICDDMIIDCEASFRRVAAMGPLVDNGELLQASALRPGVNHRIMTDISLWLEGLFSRL